MLSSRQLQHALLSSPITRPYFAGVYPSDAIPAAIPFYPCCMIWNTDTAEEPGEHWVATFVTDPAYPIGYFDPYGLPPLLPSFLQFLTLHGSFLYNPITFQGLLSTDCGYYCLYALGLKCRGWEWDSILRSFPSTIMGHSDMYIRSLVRAAFQV